MFAKEIQSFKSWLECTPVADDRLWNRKLEAISPLEIQLFYARAGLRGHKNIAVEAIDRLQSALIIGAVQGQVPAAALCLIKHEVPRARHDADEFADCLVRLRPARRQATLFALNAESSLDQVVDLSWHDVRQMQQIRSEVRNILLARSRVRILRMPHVFWEWIDDNTAAPLVELEKSIQDAFRMSWPAVVASWSEMLWMSPRADAAHFASVVEEIAAGRL